MFERLWTAAWQSCAVLTRQPRALNIIATTSRIAAWKSTTKTLKGMPSTKSCRSFEVVLRIDASSLFLLDATGSRAAWSYSRPVTACRCAGDLFFTIPHLPGISTTASLWPHHRCDFLFPAFSRYSSSTPLSSFFTARPFSARVRQYSRQGHVRLQSETVFPKQSGLPSRRWMDRIRCGTSGTAAHLDLFFPFLGRRFENLGSARCVLIGLFADQSGPPQHLRFKFKTRSGFSSGLPMADLSRNVHRRRASI